MGRSAGAPQPGSKCSPRIPCAGDLPVHLPSRQIRFTHFRAQSRQPRRRSSPPASAPRASPIRYGCNVSGTCRVRFPTSVFASGIQSSLPPSSNSSRDPRRDLREKLLGSEVPTIRHWHHEIEETGHRHNDSIRSRMDAAKRCRLRQDRDRKLDMLHYAHKVDDLRSPPANRLEALKGDLHGFFSIRVNDVSLTLETIASCNYPTPQANLRNGIEEADGSIPFSSTKALRFFFSSRLKVRFWERGERLEAPPQVLRRFSPGRAASVLLTIPIAASICRATARVPVTST